jgi:hypothetical protein
VGSSFIVFFDGTFWVGVVEVGEPDGSVRAARHVFGAEPSNAELLEFVDHHGSALIDRALSSAPSDPDPERRRARSGPGNPKRAARQAAKEQARSGTSTAAQAALAKAREQSDAARTAARRKNRSDEAERRREAAIAKRKAKHRGR